MPENPTHPDEPLTSEADLRAVYGLTSKVIAAIRHDQLTENEHWKKNGREIGYTKTGREKMAALMAAPEVDPAADTGAGAIADPLQPPGPAPDPNAPAEDAAPAPDPGEPLTVTNCRLINPRIVMAEKENGDPVRVKIRPSKNLRKGMILNPCFPVDAENGLYQFAGRMPRFPGKW